MGHSSQRGCPKTPAFIGAKDPQRRAELAWRRGLVAMMHVNPCLKQEPQGVLYKAKVHTWYTYKQQLGGSSGRQGGKDGRQASIATFKP